MPDHTIHRTETTTVEDDHRHHGVFHHDRHHNGNHHHHHNHHYDQEAVNPVVTHGDAYVHTKRDHEQRALAMAVVMLIVGFLAVVGALGFTSWAWAELPESWDGTEDGDNDTARIVLSAVCSGLYLLIVLASTIVGGLIITWFSLWVSARKPRSQRKLMWIVVALFVIIAVAYLILFLVGIAYFVIQIVQEGDTWTAFWNALLGFCYAAFFVMMALAAQRVCRVRSGF